MIGGLFSFRLSCWLGGGPWDFRDSPESKFPFFFKDLSLWIWDLDFGLGLELRLFNIKALKTFVKASLVRSSSSCFENRKWSYPEWEKVQTEYENTYKYIFAKLRSILNLNSQFLVWFWLCLSPDNFGKVQALSQSHIPIIILTDLMCYTHWPHLLTSYWILKVFWKEHGFGEVKAYHSWDSSGSEAQIWHTHKTTEYIAKGWIILKFKTNIWTKSKRW